MIKETKKKLISATIQFIFGLFFIFIVFFYLKDNPAEKVSILTWPSILYQNVKVFLYKNFTDSWDILEEKYSLERTYKELILTAEWIWCFDVEELNKINNIYSELDEMSLKEYSDKSTDFKESLSNFSQNLNGNCE